MIQMNPDYPNLNTVIFENISDIPAWLESNPSKYDRASKTSRSMSWDLGIGYEGAVEMAADGGYWPEGAEQMIEATSEAQELKSAGLAPEIDYDVTGAVLDMDEYLAGEPECFSTELQDQHIDVIKIGVQQYTSGRNDAKEYIRRGAALMSVIDDLEARGFRVEIWGCTSGLARKDFSNGKFKKDGNGIDMRTCLKRAEEAWSPSSVAFGLAHPAFARRLGFAAVESFKNLRNYMDCGHGLHHTLDRPVGSDFDIWFSYNDMVSNTYRSVEQALKMVTAEVEKQLKGRNYAKA